MDDAQPMYVRFPVDLHAKVKEYAAANDLTMAQVIRAAVRDKLEPQQYRPPFTAQDARDAMAAHAALDERARHPKPTPRRDVQPRLKGGKG